MLSFKDFILFDFASIERDRVLKFNLKRKRFGFQQKLFINRIKIIVFLNIVGLLIMSLCCFCLMLNFYVGAFRFQAKHLKFLREIYLW